MDGIRHTTRRRNEHFMSTSHILRTMSGHNNSSNHNNGSRSVVLPPKLAFLLVSLALGQLGDGLNIFQGIYLVGIGWNEGSVGTALSLMGLTALLVQPFAGDWVDKTVVDRRLFLAVAASMTALSASTIMIVGNSAADHMLMYATKVVEGMTSSFLGPCLAALTLASFGPAHFDAVMASNILWGHVGSVAAAVLAGAVSWAMYPNIKSCFAVIGASAVVAIFLVPFLPQGDPAMGRGFVGKQALDEQGRSEQLLETDEADQEQGESSALVAPDDVKPAEAVPYAEILADAKVLVLCFTGFFFHFANANVLLVLGEMMGQDGSGGQSRDAIPLVAGAIVTAQVTMTAATFAGDRLTAAGVGRKPLFMACLLSLPVRCALIVSLRNAGLQALLATQVLDGLGGGLFGLVHPYLVADITFGTGRFNVLMGVTASAFGLGATLSNYVGQMVVQEFDHVTSLMASMFLSIVPIVIFSFMPETLGKRATKNHPPSPTKRGQNIDQNHDDNMMTKASKFESRRLTMSTSYGSTEDEESVSRSSPTSHL